MLQLLQVAGSASATSEKHFTEIYIFLIHHYYFYDNLLITIFTLQMVGSNTIVSQT